ncbi:MAG: gliding motility-associated C-terminal domain-containing protein [Lewinellaceae bacterium]|nr:gliding motility-associated C-terminal domain-containing protein [Lewinellaceae bacterium]
MNVYFKPVWNLIPVALIAFFLPVSQSTAQSVGILYPAAGYDTCSPFPLVLRAVKSGPGNLEWSTGSQADSITVLDYGAYTVSFETPDTTVRDTFVINEIDCCNPVIPNAFTPNGDGVNDRFGVVLRYCEVEILEFTVYSRWGELVFQAQETTDRWDGTTLNGTEAPSDVYVFTTRYKIAGEDAEKTEKGDVTLLR